MTDSLWTREDFRELQPVLYDCYGLGVVKKKMSILCAASSALTVFSHLLGGNPFWKKTTFTKCRLRHLFLKESTLSLWSELKKKFTLERHYRNISKLSCHSQRWLISRLNNAM